MSTDPHEYQVPIILDVTAYTIEDACAAANDALGTSKIVGRTYDTDGMGIARVESAWMVEQVGKDHGDGNDNEHGVVIFQHDLDYLYTLLLATSPEVTDTERYARHARLTNYLAPGHRIGSADA